MAQAGDSVDGGPACVDGGVDEGEAVLDDIERLLGEVPQVLLGIKRPGGRGAVYEIRVLCVSTCAVLVLFCVPPNVPFFHSLYSRAQRTQRSLRPMLPPFCRISMFCPKCRWMLTMT